MAGQSRYDDTTTSEEFDIQNCLPLSRRPLSICTSANPRMRRTRRVRTT